MTEQDEQLQVLEELQAALRDALATDGSPSNLARYYHLLREVNARIDELSAA
jgi:hypothetical protein